MKIILTLLMSLCFLTVSHLAWSQSLVTVHRLSLGETYRLDDVHDLAQLTTTPALMNNTWWAGAVIATPDATTQAQRDYQHVIQQLDAWARQADGALLATIRRVKQQLLAIQVTGRQFVNLDPDIVRTRADANPRLVGDYTLYTLSAPSTITLSGAITGSGKVAWQPGTSVGDYLPAHARLAGAEHDTLMVIHADGRTETAPVGVWNARHVEAEPGSLLWVGFSAGALPAEFQALNQQIVSLLTRRVPE